MDSTEDEVMSINSLPTEQLQKIFRYLPLVERIVIERVCKRWSAVSRGCWSDVTQLNCKDLSELDIGRLLRRCGTYLRSLNIRVDVEARILAYVSRFCEKVEFLYITHKDGLKGIQRFSFRYLDLRQFTNLKSLSVINAKLDQYVLDTIPNPETITDLVLYTSDAEHRRNTPDFLHRFTNLKTLDFIRLTDQPVGYAHTFVQEDSIQPLADNCPDIEVLHLFKFWSPSTFRVIPQFRKLKVLTLVCSNVDDIFIGKLKDCCENIGELNFQSCFEITDVSLRELARLSKLRKLKLADCNITDKYLYMLHQLESLECGGSYIYDPGVIKFIQVANKLHTLKLTHNGITTETLMQATEWKTQHPEDIELEIKIFNPLYSTWKNGNHEEPPNLKIRRIILTNVD